ncbi:MAG TPA: tetratricopeptide repeat protein [Planctomycetota bacterium]|jgi:tetratricopeptide (TPR) repeat protein
MPLYARIVLRFLPLIVLMSTCRAGEDTDFRRAQSYYTLQEYKLAVESLEKYLQEFPKSERAESARLLLAESRYQLKDYAKAAADFDRYIADYAASERRHEALMRAAKAHFLLKNFDKSLAAAETFFKEYRPLLGTPKAHPALPKQFAEMLYRAGEDAYALNKSAQAKAYWEDLLKSQPDSKLIPDAADGLGALHFDAKEYDQALPRFQFVSKTPDHPRAAWAKLMEGRTLAALKKYDDALVAIKAAPALSGSGPELLAEVALRTAEVLLAAERFPAALDAYKALAKDHAKAPATAPALAAAVFACMDKQHQTEALALADLFLAVAPASIERATIQRIKARALASLADVAEAQKAAKNAVDEAAAVQDAQRKSEEHPAALMLLGELLGPQGADTYKEVVRLYPETRFGLAARYELARLSGQAGKLDEALASVQELIGLLAKQPESKTISEVRRDAFFAAGEFAFRKPDLKKAEEYLKAYSQAAGETDPRGDDVARKLAWCRHEAGDDAGAAKVLDEALAKFAKSTYRDEMLFVRGLVATKINADEALKSFDTVVSEFPASQFAAQALFDAATLLYKQSKYDAAITKLTALIDGKDYAASPLRNGALQLRASARLQAGKAAEAVSDAVALLKQDTVAELKPRLPALRLLKALALLEQKGKEAEAETALGELIQGGPPEAPEVKQGLLRRARLRFEAKNFAQAKADFAQAAGKLEPPLTPEMIDAALRLALCHKELKETAEAKALLEKLSQQQLEGVARFEVPFQIGNFLFEAGDNTAAIASYEKALAAPNIKDLPANARAAANLNLAWALKRTSANEKAAAAFGEVVKAEPDGAYAAEALFERGRLLDEAGKGEDAVAAWKEILDRKADSPFAEKAMLARSQSLAKSAKFADAATGFESYIQKYGTPPVAGKDVPAAVRDAWCGLAECRLRTAGAKAAREAFTKALGEKGLDTDLDDTAERALLGLAEICIKEGDPLAAKKMALRILTDRPNSPWRDAAYFAAGQSSEQLAEPEKAIGYYRKMLAEFPKSTHADAAGERLKALGAPKNE